MVYRKNKVQKTFREEEFFLERARYKTIRADFFNFEGTDSCIFEFSCLMALVRVIRGKGTCYLITNERVIFSWSFSQTR